MNLNLSEDEARVFALLQKNDELSLDQICILTGARRQSMIVRMKYLAAKLAPEGWIIINKSGIGRGNKAVYAIEKKF